MPLRSNLFLVSVLLEESKLNTVEALFIRRIYKGVKKFYLLEVIPEQIRTCWVDVVHYLLFRGSRMNRQKPFVFFDMRRASSIKASWLGS